MTLPLLEQPADGARTPRWNRRTCVPPRGHSSVDFSEETIVIPTSPKRSTKHARILRQQRRISRTRVIFGGYDRIALFPLPIGTATLTPRAPRAQSPPGNTGRNRDAHDARQSTTRYHGNVPVMAESAATHHRASESCWRLEISDELDDLSICARIRGALPSWRNRTNVTARVFRDSSPATFRRSSWHARPSWTASFSRSRLAITGTAISLKLSQPARVTPEAEDSEFFQRLPELKHGTTSCTWTTASGSLKDCIKSKRRGRAIHAPDYADGAKLYVRSSALTWSS